jgi:mycoredoxin-dependent peroxiredoxin
MRLQVRAVVLGLLLATGAAAQESSKAPPSRPPRDPQSSPRNTPAQGHIAGQIYLGEDAPDFELDGSRGKPVRLSSFRGEWVVLVFADRREQLAKLSVVDSDMKEMGAALVGVCKEKAYVLERYAPKIKLPFLLLADWSGEIAALYGLYNYERSEILPGFLVLDRAGTVRSAFVGVNFPPEELARIARFAVTGL